MNLLTGLRATRVWLADRRLRFHSGLLAFTLLCCGLQPQGPSPLLAQAPTPDSAAAAASGTEEAPSADNPLPEDTAASKAMVDGASLADPSDAAATKEPRSSRRETLLASLTVFVLAVFLGFELITKVPPTLHTPLMSGSNAISGITVVGALLATGTEATSWTIPLLGCLAVVMATINCVGGFAVTHRMLSMFRRR